eukprot:3858087-Prymnesium_polylepis.2
MAHTSAAARVLTLLAAVVMAHACWPFDFRASSPASRTSNNFGGRISTTVTMEARVSSIGTYGGQPFDMVLRSPSGTDSGCGGERCSSALGGVD